MVLKKRFITFIGTLYVTGVLLGQALTYGQVSTIRLESGAKALQYLPENFDKPTDVPVAT